MTNAEGEDDAEALAFDDAPSNVTASVATASVVVSSTDAPAVPVNSDAGAIAGAAAVEDEGDAVDDEGDEGDAMEDEGDAMEDERDAVEDEGDAMEDERDAVDEGDAVDDEGDEGDAMEDERDAVEDEGDAMEGAGEAQSGSPGLQWTVVQSRWSTFMGSKLRRTFNAWRTLIPELRKRRLAVERAKQRATDCNAETAERAKAAFGDAYANAQLDENGCVVCGRADAPPIPHLESSSCLARAHPLCLATHVAEYARKSHGLRLCCPGCKQRLAGCPAIPPTLKCCDKPVRGGGICFKERNHLGHCERASAERAREVQERKEAHDAARRQVMQTVRQAQALLDAPATAHARQSEGDAVGNAARAPADAANGAASAAPDPDLEDLKATIASGIETVGFCKLDRNLLQCLGEAFGGAYSVFATPQEIVTSTSFQDIFNRTFHASRSKRQQGRCAKRARDGSPVGSPTSTIVEFERMVRHLLDALGLLATSKEGVRKTVLDAYALVSKKGCERQLWHADSAPPRAYKRLDVWHAWCIDESNPQCEANKRHLHERRNLPPLPPAQDVPLVVLYATSDASLHVRPFLLCDTDEYTLELSAGDVVIFRGDLAHAGAAYASENVRLHVYVDSPLHPRCPNTTYDEEYAASKMATFASDYLNAMIPEWLRRKGMTDDLWRTATRDEQQKILGSCDDANTVEEMMRQLQERTRSMKRG